MSFTSPALERLREARARKAAEAEPLAAPLPAPPPLPPVQPPQADVPPPRPQARGEVEHPPTPSAAPETVRRGRNYPRPDLAARAASRGHCGTCAAFTLRPAEGRFMGECAHGWGAHYPGEGARGLPVIIHEAARCMTAPFPRWALRAGVVLLAEPDPVGGAA